MITRHIHGELVWVDVVSPTSEEVRALMEEFSIDPPIANELTAPSFRNRVDTREGYLYVVFHFPAFKHLHDLATRPIELDFIIGKTWIITARYDSIDPLHHFSALFDVDTVLDKRTMGEHAGLVFYYMLYELYSSLYDELGHIDARLDAAEDRIFEGFERDMVKELSNISRDLLNYMQALDSHHQMLLSLETPGVALFGYEYARNVRSIVSEYERLASALKSHRASLNELRETNNSLLTTKQNETMKIFTIMAFVTFPLSLLAAVFGMNTTYTPIVGHPYDFWIITGIMLGATVSFFAFFKHKRWL